MKSSKTARPRLPLVSDATRRLASIIEAEVLGWPNVTSRPMFGLNGVYRGSKIFAVLPRTRAMDERDSIAFRLPRQVRKISAALRKDERIVTQTPEAKWISFVIRSEADIHDALKWLALAYRETTKSPTK